MGVENNEGSQSRHHIPEHLVEAERLSAGDWVVATRELDTEYFSDTKKAEVYPPSLAEHEHECDTEDTHWLVYSPEDRGQNKEYGAQLHVSGEVTPHYLVISLWPYEVQAHSHNRTHLIMLGKLEDVRDHLVSGYLSGENLP